MWSDWVVLGAVLAGIVWGAWKGLAWQLAGVLSLVFGFFFGVPAAGRILKELGREGELSWFVAFALCYAAICLACFIGAAALRNGLERARLGGFNRHMGAFTGAAHGMVLASLVVLGVMTLAPQTRPAVMARVSGQLVQRTLDAVHEALPDEVDRLLEGWTGRADPDPDADGP